ncbi:TolC family protein [Salinimonas lutimaris]|uniref:TolC family protein n=1 Tax=Salinimonas lutimaris TaxID=914153 RepID=UPI0010C084D1|nr:TolC family protein [Salinimonas lutimaris]
MSAFRRKLNVTLTLLTIAVSAGVGAQSLPPLDSLVTTAIANDPWLNGSKLSQQAMQQKAIAASTLPDPVVKVGMLNLPVDSGSFSQENMTQLQVGVTQMLARGQSLELEQQKLNLAASIAPSQRDTRKAAIARAVSLLWLDIYLAKESIVLIEQNKTLFEQAKRIAETAYSSGLGEASQQDVILAELELIQLEDRLAEKYQQLEIQLHTLNQWLLNPRTGANSSLLTVSDVVDSQPHEVDSKGNLPEFRLKFSEAWLNTQIHRTEVLERLLTHPSITAIDLEQQVREKDVSLARQSLKPQWSVNASYAYRDENAMGDSRSDLFSVGVSFDVPLFTDNKQQKQISAAIYNAEAFKTEKHLAIRKLLSQVASFSAKLTRLNERQSLYTARILPQTTLQSKASLNAYTNDTGDFSEVIRSRVTELTNQLTLLTLNVSVAKTKAQLNYLLAPFSLTSASSTSALTKEQGSASNE